MVASAIARPTVMSDPDLALVQRCKQNDLAAFEELVCRYQGKLYNFVCKTTSNAQDAEDLVQDIFVRVYRSLHRFRGESTFQTWLYRRAHNMCVDRSRHVSRRVRATFSLDARPAGREDSTGEQRRELADATAVPSDLAERQELRQQVRQCVAKLSEKLRVVVVLYDLQGFSYDEIAQILGCPLGTVKSRLFNARVELARLLEPYLNDEGRRPSLATGGQP